MARRPTAYARLTDERQNERARERSTGPITIPRLGNSFPDVFYIPGTDLVLTQPRTELIRLIPGNSRSREFPPVPNIWLSHICNHTHRCQLHRAKTTKTVVRPSRFYVEERSISPLRWIAAVELVCNCSAKQPDIRVDQSGKPCSK